MLLCWFFDCSSRIVNFKWNLSTCARKLTHNFSRDEFMWEKGQAEREDIIVIFGITYKFKGKSTQFLAISILPGPHTRLLLLHPFDDENKWNFLVQRKILPSQVFYASCTLAQEITLCQSNPKHSIDASNILLLDFIKERERRQPMLALIWSTNRNVFRSHLGAFPTHETSALTHDTALLLCSVVCREVKFGWKCNWNRN